MADRLDRARLDDQSCTVRPCSGADVGLATTPETTTFPLGLAVIGLSDVIAIHGCDRASGWLAVAVRTAPAPAPGAAAAGTVASHAAPSAAATAASRKHRRVAARPRGCRSHAMPKMLLPIVGCRLRPAIISRRCRGGAAAA